MFNDAGEIAIFRRVGLHPVFFGETIIGDKEANALLLQVYDPAAFGPVEAFLEQIDQLQARCRDCAPDDATRPVRVPGEAAWSRRRRQLADGVELHPDILPRWQPWLARFGVEAPQPIH